MIRIKTTPVEIVIDLTGPQGNAFALFAYAKDFAKQLGLNYDTIKEEMASGNYEDLIECFDGYFGDYVVLER